MTTNTAQTVMEIAQDLIEEDAEKVLASFLILYPEEADNQEDYINAVINILWEKFIKDINCYFQEL